MTEETAEELRRRRLEGAYHTSYDAQPESTDNGPLDMLREAFCRQAGFMGMLQEDGRFPQWPIDLSTKENQRLLQGFLWDTVREITEASAELRNRPHRVREEGFDRAAFLEEMGDAFAFFMEDLLLAGFSADDLYKEYLRKNRLVREALITRER